MKCHSKEFGFFILETIVPLRVETSNQLRLFVTFKSTNCTNKQKYNYGSTFVSCVFQLIETNLWYKNNTVKQSLKSNLYSKDLSEKV